MEGFTVQPVANSSDLDVLRDMGRWGRQDRDIAVDLGSKCVVVCTGSRGMHVEEPDCQITGIRQVDPLTLFLNFADRYTFSMYRQSTPN
jgi:hypothetical protein